MQEAPILLFENDAILCDLIQLCLEQIGLEVVTVRSGNEAYNAYLNHKPRVVLLDLFLPQTNPISLIKQIRSAEEGTSIIVLSAFGYKEVVEQALEAGANDYLLKPINPEVLIERVKKALQTPSKPKQQKVITKPVFRKIR